MSKIRIQICSSLLLLFFVIKDCNASENGVMAFDPERSIYYDPGTNATLPIEWADSSRLPLDPIRFTSNGLPCSCDNLRCGCCTGINITVIKFNRHVCANVTVVPEELALDFYVFMDDDEVMSNRLTGRYPPPACIPLNFLPIVSFCVRFFDLYVRDEKFHICMDFETRIGMWTVFILHFNCVEITGNGTINWLTPSFLSDNSAPAIPLIVSDAEEVYDPVDFEPVNETIYLHTSTRSPEEHLGNFKIQT